jgi:5,10-methylenetetrahydromethanopterin reductase
MRWHDVETYIRQLRGLLRGEQVEIDGAVVQMIAPAWFLPQRPIEVPIVVAANGPKGLRVARELGDGVMMVTNAQPGFAWCAVLAFGTVLDDGELPTSRRALAAAGPGLTVVYHALYEGDPSAIDGLPGGVQWRAEVERIPEAVRHLALHEDHLVHVTERDTRLLNGDALAAFTWTGTAPELRARLDTLEAAGATEILYAPMGPDVPRELGAFASMAGVSRRH